MVALAVLAIILLALTLDAVATKLSLRQPAISTQAATPRPGLDWIAAPVPTGLSLAPNHMWTRRDGEDVVRVGGDGFAAALLGCPDKVEFLTRPGPVVRGQALASISRQGQTLMLRAPIDGTLVETNAFLDPKNLLADPFGRGWLVTLQPERDDAVESPHDGTGIVEWLAAEWERARQVAMGSLEPSSVVGAVMADGGDLQPGFLLHLSGESRQAVQCCFLGAGPEESETSEATTEEMRA